MLLNRIGAYNAQVFELFFNLDFWRLPLHDYILGLDHESVISSTSVTVRVRLTPSINDFALDLLVREPTLDYDRLWLAWKLW